MSVPFFTARPRRPVCRRFLGFVHLRLEYYDHLISRQKAIYRKRGAVGATAMATQSALATRRAGCSQGLSTRPTKRTLLVGMSRMTKKNGRSTVIVAEFSTAERLCPMTAVAAAAWVPFSSTLT
jgi:hypothetical protein